MLLFQPPARYWEKVKDENKDGKDAGRIKKAVHQGKNAAQKRKQQEENEMNGKKFISGVRMFCCVHKPIFTTWRMRMKT